MAFERHRVHEAEALGGCDPVALGGGMSLGEVGVES